MGISHSVHFSEPLARVDVVQQRPRGKDDRHREEHHVDDHPWKGRLLDGQPCEEDHVGAEYDGVGEFHSAAMWVSTLFISAITLRASLICRSMTRFGLA